MICSSACSYEIWNQSAQEIYIVLKPEDKIDIKSYRHFVDASKVAKFKRDTVKDTATFIIPPARQPRPGVTP